jgi:hypothetical protein
VAFLALLGFCFFFKKKKEKNRFFLFSSSIKGAIHQKMRAPDPTQTRKKKQKKLP